MVDLFVETGSPSMSAFNQRIEQINDAFADKLSKSGDIMLGPLEWGNDRLIGTGAWPSELEISAGRVSIRLMPENIADGIGACAVLRDTGTGVLYPIATATPPTAYDLPLNSGYIKNSGCVYFKTQDGIVHCIGSVLGNFAQLETHFANLPSGFRPKEAFALPAAGRNAECSATITILPEGLVTFWPEKVCQGAYFSFAFVAN